MSRFVEQLTEAKIRNLTAPGLYADGRGLYLQVRGAGVRSWIYRFTLNGRTRDMGLGALAETGLVAARTKTAECSALRTRGIDPIDHAKAMRASVVMATAPPAGPTFRDVAEEYMAEKLRHLRSDSHRRQWHVSLETFANPILGELPVSAVRTDHLLRVLRPIWQDRCETAMRLRGRIERILAYAGVKGHRTGNNPAAWRGHLKEALPSRSEVSPVVHHAAMTFAEVPAFMAALRARSDVSAAALQFLILCAGRTGEVVGARWYEIDIGHAQWTIPGPRMKSGRPHTVPLSTGALTVLDQMSPLRDIGGGFVFPGMKPSGMSHTTLLGLLQRDMKRRDVTCHGFRSSFRDWCGDVADVPREIAEAALAHVVSDSTERAYRRGTALERRRKLMQEWCNYCSTTVVVADLSHAA